MNTKTANTQSPERAAATSTTPPPLAPQPTIIKTRYEGGKYVASIEGKDVATHAFSEHGAAKFAAGPSFWVKEVNPHVFRAVPK